MTEEMLPVIAQLQILTSHHLCNTLSKPFEVFSAIILEVYLLLSVSLPLSNRCQNISSGQDRSNMYCLSPNRLFLLSYSTTFFFIIASKFLLTTLKRLMSLGGDKNSPAFLKIGHALDIFHRFGNDLSLKQRLNNLAKIGSNSGLMFFGDFFHNLLGLILLLIYFLVVATVGSFSYLPQILKQIVEWKRK